MRIAVFLAALFSAPLLFAAPVTDVERDAITKEVLRRVRVDAKRLDHEALATVFDATFYEAELVLDEGGGSSTSSTIQLTRKGDRWIQVENPTTDQELPVLTSLVRDAYRLHSKQTAVVFEQALDQLFPVHAFGDKREPKEILRKGRDWIFVRGLFFDDKQGFVVTTDEAGKIVEIRQQLRLPRK